MGDPSLMVYFGMPGILTANYPPTIPVNTEIITIETNPYAYVALSHEGELLGAAQANINGIADITISPFPNPATIDVVITHQNKQPHFGSFVFVGAPFAATDPDPSNGATLQDPFTSLTWGPGNGGIPTEYRISLGTDNPPTNIVYDKILVDNIYFPEEEFEYETQYFWKIDSYNEYGSATGDVWNFTINRPPDEDFESGDFMAQYWSSGGDAEWAIDNSTVFHGNFSACSGDIDDNQSTSIKIDLVVDALIVVPISFWKKISSHFYDRLQFFIDGEKMGEWSGIQDSFTKHTFTVTGGLHTFEWKYIKDGEGSSGDDCVWIDFIYFLPLQPATVSAGDDDMVCEGMDYQLSGQGTNFCYPVWSTSGTGTFDDSMLLDAMYYPGEEDYINGSVTLTLLLHTPEEDLTDDMTLSFDPLPEIPATPEGPEFVNPEITVSSEYTTSGAQFANTYTWEIVPETAGSLDGDGTNIVVIWNPSYLGMVNLTVTGINDCGDGEESEALGITLDNSVGLDSPERVSDLRIVPNPAPDWIQLSIQAQGTRYKAEVIEIFDLLGNRISVIDPVDTQNDLRIDVSEYQNGIYFLVIRSKDSIVGYSKFVVNH